jgi:hypothetical protein
VKIIENIEENLDLRLNTMLLALMEDSETIEELEDPPAATSENEEIIGNFFSLQTLLGGCLLSH